MDLSFFATQFFGISIAQYFYIILIFIVWELLYWKGMSKQDVNALGYYFSKVIALICSVFICLMILLCNVIIVSILYYIKLQDIFIPVIILLIIFSITIINGFIRKELDSKKPGVRKNDKRKK